MIVANYPPGVKAWHEDGTTAARVRMCFPTPGDGTAARILVLELVGDTFLEHVFWWEAGVFAYVAQVKWKEWGPGVWWLSPSVIERPHLIPAALALVVIRAGRSVERAARARREVERPGVVGVRVCRGPS